MSRYGEDILDDRGPHPKNAGDRAYGHGLTITVDANEDLDAGVWVNFDGDGGVDAEADPGTEGADALTKLSADAGEEIQVHTRGVVRATEDSADATQVDSFDDGDVLVEF